VRREIIVSLILLLCFAGASRAMSSSSYVSSGGLGTGGGVGLSTSFKNTLSIGVVASPTMSSPSYSSVAGIIPILTLAPSGDGSAPVISNIEFDRLSVVNNDLIKKNATLTATVTDEPSGISVEASRVIVDGTATTFNLLTLTSTYDVATGALTYNLNLAGGSHIITLEAWDKSGNSAMVALVVKVDTGDLTAAQTFINPNPFNPGAGTARLAYQLNQDADITLYMFNEINQAVWKKICRSGSNGGRTGYNEIEWDGVSDFNEVVGNGVYFLRIVSGGKVIGKIKIAVLK